MQPREQRPMYLFYLAGPQDGAPPDCNEWRDELAAEGRIGVAFFNPVKAWLGVNELTIAACDLGNRAVMARCSGVIANLAVPGRAFGTIREIEAARHRGQPVAVITGQQEPLESLLAYDLIQAPTPVEALDAITEYIMAGVSQHPLFRLMQGGDDG